MIDVMHNVASIWGLCPGARAEITETHCVHRGSWQGRSCVAAQAAVGNMDQCTGKCDADVCSTGAPAET